MIVSSFLDFPLRMSYVKLAWQRVLAGDWRRDAISKTTQCFSSVTPNQACWFTSQDPSYFLSKALNSSLLLSHTSSSIAQTGGLQIPTLQPTPICQMLEKWNPFELRRGRESIWLIVLSWNEPGHHIDKLEAFRERRLLNVCHIRPWLMTLITLHQSLERLSHKMSLIVLYLSLKFVICIGFEMWPFF